MRSDLLARIEQGIAETEMRITTLLQRAEPAALDCQTVRVLRQTVGTRRFLRDVVLRQSREPTPRSHPPV